MKQLRSELMDTEEMIVQLAQTVEAEIGSAMSSAITGILDGTKTAEEALADMFKNIGEAFISMATQIIAKQLVMIALQSILKALGAVPGGGLKGANGVPGLEPNSYWGQAANTVLFVPSKFSGGGYTGNGPRVGGVDGQGGFPAILHPQETVVDHTKSRSAMGMYSPSNQYVAAGGDMTPTINYNGPTLNFNGDDYIPRSEAGALVSAGAKQGEQRAMNWLRQSRSTRSKIGI